MEVPVLDFVSLVLLYPWWSFFVFCIVYMLMKIFLGIFLSLPEKMPFWFFAYKTFFFFAIVSCISILLLDNTLFAPEKDFGPAKNVSERSILLACAENIIFREAPDGSYGVPLIATFPLYRCMNLKQGERMTGVPLSKLSAEKDNETLATFLSKNLDDIDFRKEGKGFPVPYSKKKNKGME